MSKKKNELEDKIEQLEAELQAVKKVNKSLVRRLRKIDNKFDEEEYLEESEIKKKYEGLEQYICPHCKKRSMDEIEIAGRIFRRCDSCGKRTKAQKI